MSISHLINPSAVTREDIYVNDIQSVSMTVSGTLETKNITNSDSIESKNITNSNLIESKLLEVTTAIIDTADIKTLGSSNLVTDTLTVLGDSTQGDIFATGLTLISGINFTPLQGATTTTGTVSISTKNLVFCTFNNIADTASNALVTLTITNAQIIGTSLPLVWVQTQTVTAGSCFVIKSYQQTGVSTAITIFNCGLSSTGVASITIAYIPISTNI